MDHALAVTSLILAVLVTLWVIALAVADGLLRVYRGLKAPTVVHCPNSAAPAALQLQAVGATGVHVRRCSRWPEHAGCAQACLEQVRPDSDSTMGRTGSSCGGLPCAA